MESTVTNFYDYTQSIIPDDLRCWHIADDEVLHQLEAIGKNYASEIEAACVEKYDSVACRGESQIARWNRDSLRFYPGRRLCDEEIEDALLGAKVGEKREIHTQEGTISLTVTRIIRRTGVPIDDELAKKAGIDGVNSIQDFYRWYREENGAKRRERAKYWIAGFLRDEIVEKSAYSIDEPEKQEFITGKVDMYYDAKVDAGIDPTVPEDGVEFLTEEQVKASWYPKFEPDYLYFVVNRHISRMCLGDDLDRFCTEEIRKIAAQYNITGERLMKYKHHQVSNIYWDVAGDFLAQYAEQFLED